MSAEPAATSPVGAVAVDPSCHGLHPFWFWNGEVTAEEIRWQIARMAEQGVRGFFIHSRQGLTVPYLSDAFLRLVEVAVTEARARGMTVHLYDEYPYPSGVAGGEVVLGSPQFLATTLRHERLESAGGRLRRALPRGKVLACTAFPLVDGHPDWTRPLDLRSAVGLVLSEASYHEGGLTAYNRKRFFASDPVPVVDVELPPGPFRVYVSVQVLVTHHKYWGHFIDVLNPAAVRRFLDLTHERYRRRLGAEFGRTIRSIFVDETEPGWSDGLPAAFEREYGRDLLPLLPALQDPAHPGHANVRADLGRLTHRLFCESFEQPVSDWCRQNGLRYTGEKPSWRLSQLAYMDVPGCEPGHNKAGAARLDLLRPNPRQNARATASAAYFYGKPGSLCECYHSLGWSGTLLDARLIAESLVLMGITALVPHGFFFTTHGLAKHDAPPTFFFQMPYWSLFGRLSQRIGRILHRFHGTWIDASVLVVDPSPGLPDAEQQADYERLLWELSFAHIEFLVADTDILRAGRCEGGRLRVRDLTVNTVVVPGMRVIEPSLAAWLEEFERGGGCVVRVRAAGSAAAAREAVQPRVRPALRLSAAEGDAKRVLAVARTDGRRRCWLLINTGTAAVELRLDSERPLRELALDDEVPSALRVSAGVVARRLEAFESVLIEEADARVLPAPIPVVRMRVSGPMRVRPLRANLLRMYEWRMSLAGDPSGATALVPAIPLVHQLEKGRFRYAPAVHHFFGVAPELGLPELNVSYAFEFDNRWDGAVQLAMEPGSIEGSWGIAVNDTPAVGPEAFAPADVHVRGSLGLDITARLRPGLNTVRVDVRTARKDGGLRNALYLAGAFGVRLGAPPALVSPVASGDFDDYDANGLPYFSGSVEYESEIDVGGVPDGACAVEIEPGVPFQDACEASFNGGPWHALPWPPYVTKVDAGELRAGKNNVRLRVHTTLIRAFEGQWFDIAAHATREVGGR